MEEVESPYLLLNWLQSGAEEMQLSALEQLCLALLQYESNEALVKFYPPSTYIPILACLCQDFDISFVLLEAIIRTITYYMQALPHEVINRLVNTKGSLIAICMRLENPNMNNPIESDLAQQIIKLLEELCKRDTKSLANIGGTSYIISFMSKTYEIIHLDTIKSGFFILYKIIDKIDPTDNRLAEWFEFLSKFFKHSDSKIVEYSLHCLLSIVKTCNEKKISTDHLGIEKIIDSLLEMSMAQLKMDNQIDNESDITGNLPVQNLSSKVGLSKVVIDLILSIIRGSHQFLCNLLVKSNLVDIILEILWQYDSSSLTIMQLIEGMFDQITEKCNYKSQEYIQNSKFVPAMGMKMIHSRIYSDEMIQQYTKYHDYLFQTITNGNLDHLKEILLSADFDPFYKDIFGQTCLNWASSIGFIDAISLLQARGVDANVGDRATSWHYAASQGHISVIECLLKNQSADFNMKDIEGMSVIERLQSYIESSPDPEKVSQIKNLIEKFENQRSSADEDVILAKQYFIKRMIPIIMLIYFKSHKATIRYHVLESLEKIFLSFTNRDHETFINEIYQENNLPYHFSKLIYRVLLQDTGENVLEAIKCCLYLINNKNYSIIYLNWFTRMGLRDILDTVKKRLLITGKEETPNPKDKRIIPLTYNMDFAENKNVLKSQNYTLNKLQPYYWGDWNILTTEDGLNLYNEFCYVFISTEKSVNNLKVSILTRKLNSVESTEKENVKALNPQLFDNLAKPKSLKAETNDQASDAGGLMKKDESNEYEKDLEYSAVEINDKEVNYKTDLIPILLNKYSSILLSMKPVSLPVQFPKLPVGKLISVQNLIISNFTNQLKISYDSNKVNDIKNNDDKVSNDSQKEECFIEISINSIAGLIMKAQNQVIYKSGPLNKQSGLKKLELKNNTSTNIDADKNKRSQNNPLKELICFRLSINCREFSKILKSVSKPNNTLEKNVSKLINALENKKTQIQDLKNYFIIFNDILNATETSPTPYELYKSRFIKALEILFQKFNLDSLDDLLKVIHSNFPKLTKMLVQLIEQMENLPSNFQIHSYISEHYLTRSIHMGSKLKICNDHQRYDTDPIPDISKYNFLVMPLTSPAFIKKRIINLLQKLPWYRANKNHYNSFRQLAQQQNVHLDYSFENNQKGFFNWLATNAFHSDLFMNPIKLDLITVTVSETASNLLSSFHNLFAVHSDSPKDKTTFGKNYISVQGQNSFLSIQLKHPLGLIPSHYKLGCPKSSDNINFALLNWKLMASIDGIEWDILSVHQNDKSIIESSNGWHVWPLNIELSILEKVKNQGWSNFKIQLISDESDKEQNIKMKDQENLCNNWQTTSSYTLSKGLCINVIEFYGNVYAISDKRQQEIAKNVQDYLSKFKIKTIVKPGPDWSYDNKESYKVGKTLTLIKNGTVLVEWIRDSGKCHIRHKMGSQGKYEVCLATDETFNENEEKEVIKTAICESVLESRSSNEIRQEFREHLRNSYQDSISWIVDPNISMPIRTSSLSSQRNSRLPSFSNRDNWIDGIVSKETSRNFKSPQDFLDGAKDYNILIQSETEDFDLHDDNSEFENINIDFVMGKTKTSAIKKENNPDYTSSNKPIIQMNDKMALKNNDEMESKSQYLSKSTEESKKSFSLSKQTKRKNYHIVNMFSETKKDITKKDIIKFNTLTEDIEMSDESEDFEILQCPENFMKFSKNSEKNEIGHCKSNVKRKPYNSYVKNKFKTNINGTCEPTSKFKPITIEEMFPGVVPAIDQRSTSNLSQIRSNVEKLNYKSIRKSQKTGEISKIKNFGYDLDQFCVKLQIQKYSANNNYINNQRFHDFECLNDYKGETNFSFNSTNSEINKKMVYEFSINSDITFPVINYILKMLPSPDNILNIYPIDQISEMWHSQFTLFYGFCDGKDSKCICNNCFYDNVKNINLSNEVLNKTMGDIDMILNVLKYLKCLQIRFTEISNNQSTTINTVWNDSCFTSHYICKKLISQLEDVWSLLSPNTLPSWVIEWPQRYPFIFLYDVKIDILRALWFGVSRSIIWLQQNAKPNSDFIRPSFREDFIAPFQFLGRLKKHIAQVPRPYFFGNTTITEIESRSIFWSAVKDLLFFHSRSKEELEIQFDQEEGTGLGPTLEFINILSKEFLRPNLLMWVHSVSSVDEEAEFVHSKNGVFPYPWPVDKLSDDILEKFRLLGIFMAKCLQDNRRIDIPFSEPFLKLVCKDFADYETQEYLAEFSLIYPERGEFLRSIDKFCVEKQKFLKTLNGGLSRTLWKFHDRLKTIAINIFGLPFESLCIDMEFLPSSKIFGTESYPLYDQYSWEEDSDSLNDICNIGNDYDNIREPVTEYNAEKYLQRTLIFSMKKGIKKQISKLKDGFNEVFPIKSLSMFTPTELKQLLCGEQHIQWTINDLQKYTEPSQGYTSTSNNYQNLLSILFEMTQMERKAFVQFVTGCSSLPPGGLKNLKPRLTVVKKNIKDGGPYPSVNTCMHYLKIPEYQTKAELKSKLSEACKQIGFYLN